MPLFLKGFSFRVLFLLLFLQGKNQTLSPLIYLKVINLSVPQFSSVFPEPAGACPLADRIPNYLTWHASTPQMNTLLHYEITTVITTKMQNKKNFPYGTLDILNSIQLLGIDSREHKNKKSLMRNVFFSLCQGGNKILIIKGMHMIQTFDSQLPSKIVSNYTSTNSVWMTIH